MVEQQNWPIFRYRDNAIAFYERGAYHRALAWQIILKTVWCDMSASG
jgi:hypothetical protein